MVFSKLKNLKNHLFSKLILTVGISLLLVIATWAYFNIEYQKKRVMKNVVASTDKLGNTIKLGTHYAMMSNSRDDINQIINNIAKQEGIENIRIYNKDGQIKFTNQPSEVDRLTNIKAEACDICHRTEPPLVNVGLDQRTRIFQPAQGHRVLGIISPIRNDPGCSTGDCHVHPQDKQILGALDVVVSLKETEREIVSHETEILVLAVFIFVITSTIIFIFELFFVNRPVKTLIDGTRQIAKGDYLATIDVNQDDEMGQLANAITQMGKEIGKKQDALNKQRNEYQNLFEIVPCLITVQDRNYDLIKFNREFEEKFNPKIGERCYAAYKGRTEKCQICPVEKTFQDGGSYVSEEIGYNKDGSVKHFFVRTSPIRDDSGEIVAAMEVSLDISQRKHLEEKLERSEKKYHAIFNNIPNPVFVLDIETLIILDCNESVRSVYQFEIEEILGKNFLDLFREDEKDYYGFKLKTSAVINQARHSNKEGKALFVNIRISPSEYSGQKVLLVTTSDITKRLETEQQLIQASKLATLGEMATGVAHELNQPLSVIKTASSFFIKKIDHQQSIDEDILSKMLRKIDGNVDRATRIINHMRQFARKSDLALSRIHVEEVLEKAFEIFSQQLKVRGIAVVWEISDALPMIKADPGRLEQVFINLLINARDAIEEQWENRGKFQSGQQAEEEKKIFLRSFVEGKKVIIKLEDTGSGIPNEICEKIFEPFFTTKEVGKGTGLGLSISYSIVKECNGHIWVTSREDGPGASFVLEFPIPEDENKTGASDNSGDAKVGGAFYESYHSKRFQKPDSDFIPSV